MHPLGQPVRQPQQCLPFDLREKTAIHPDVCGCRVRHGWVPCPRAGGYRRVECGRSTGNAQGVEKQAQLTRPCPQSLVAGNR